MSVRGKGILFIEPLTSDSYCYTPLADVGIHAKDRVTLALATLGQNCRACFRAPRHLWMPQDDLDVDAMAKQEVGEYWSIPSEPALWKESIALCDEHVIGQLQEYIEQSGYYFLTFRYPDSSDRGYYW